MNASITTYLLGGALAASLAWNFRSTWSAPGPSDCTSCVTGSGDCSAAIAGLDLSAEQRAALASWNATACSASVAGESRAKELGRELYAALAATELDGAKARELADEIGRLRARGLRDCVDSVIEVRRVLSPEQVAQLLGSCCAPGGG